MLGTELTWWEKDELQADAYDGTDEIPEEDCFGYI